MRRFVKTSRFVLAGLATILAVGVGPLSADEPAAEFLDALREAGYYDVAIEYLDQIKDDPIVSDEFRATIPFERASTLIDQVATLRDRKQIEQQLDEAQQLLAQYAGQTDSLVENVRTLNFRSQLLSRRADLFLKEAAAEHLTAEEREKLLMAARSYLNEALDSITTAIKGAERLLDRDPGNTQALKIRAEDPSSRKLVLEIRGVYQSLLVQRPYVAERLADTFAPQAPQRRQLLLDAAEVLNQVWNQYPSSVAGVQACVYSGRCYQKLEQHQKALNQFSQVMALNNTAATGSLRKLAFSLATDSWQVTDPYPARSVIGQIEPIVEKLSAADKRDPNWLRVVLELGMAKRALAETVRGEKAANATTRAKSIDREAARLVRDVTRAPSPHRERAKRLLEQWDVPLVAANTDGNTDSQLDSFSAAFEAGKTEVAEIELLAGEVLGARNTGDPSASLQAQLTQACDQAIGRFDLAIRLADSSISPDDLNRCRFFQCYCYFVSQRHLEAAIIGQFLLDQHAEKEGTKQASGLLLRSRSALVAAAGDAQDSYDIQAWKNSARVVAERWPGSAESSVANQALIQMAVREGRLADAVEYIDKIPADSEMRALSAGLLGQQLFAQYLRDLKDPELRLNTNHMRQKLDRVTTLLRSATNAARAQPMSFRNAVTGLKLVESLLLAGDADAALQVLDSSPVSPLKIIKDKTPAIFNDSRAEKFKSDAYRAIVKVYIAKLQDSEQQQFWVDKATGVINLMKQEFTANQDIQKQDQLTAIYQLIAIELKKRFDSLQDTKQKAKFAKVLAQFLDSIGKNSRRGNVVLIAGATMLDVAAGLVENGQSEQAKPLYRQAVAMLGRAEKLGFRGEEDAAKLGFELKRQRALAERGAGNFKAAVQQFTEILQQSSSFAVQLDAAQTLQQWGKIARLQQPLVQAVNGTGKHEDPKSKRSTNAIWGWRKIQAATRGNKSKFRDPYFMASFSIAEALYEQSLMLKKTEDKKTALRLVKRETVKTPDFLGSQKWKDKFAELEKRIGGQP